MQRDQGYLGRFAPPFRGTSQRSIEKVWENLAARPQSAEGHSLDTFIFWQIPRLNRWDLRAELLFS